MYRQQPINSNCGKGTFFTFFINTLYFDKTEEILHDNYHPKIFNHVISFWRFIQSEMISTIFCASLKPSELAKNE